MTYHIQLNRNKIEVLVITTPSPASKHSCRHRWQHPGSDALHCAPVLSVKSQVLKLCQVAYFHLSVHRFHSINHCPTQHATDPWFNPSSYSDWIMEIASFTVYPTKLQSSKRCSSRCGQSQLLRSSNTHPRHSSLASVNSVSYITA